MNLQPFERKNLIFIDTEFSDLDPYRGEILSIGIVKMNGEELYIELESDSHASEWVKKHILKTLDGPKFSRLQAVNQIKGFLGNTQPFAVAFVDNYDVIYITKLFGAGKLPFRWMTIDLASVLFAVGVNPVKYQLDNETAKDFYKKLGIDTRLLRDVWLKLTTKE
jgi:hypothetical protein